MIGAAIVLSVVHARRWWVVAPGLIAVQLALAPFTSPRGDNDGLWILILPILVVLGTALTVLCGIVGIVTGFVRRRAPSHEVGA
jgi:hypothetical protein